MGKQHVLVSVIGIGFGLSLLLGGCATQQGEAVYQPAVAKLIEKASSLKNANQTDAAICRLEAAADIAPNTYQVQYNLGVLYSESSRYAPAIEHLNKALTISPNQPNGLYTLGYTYESLGDQYFLVAQAQSPEEARELNVSEEVKALPQSEALTRGKEAYQQAIDVYERFLDAAPASDPARDEVTNQIQSLNAKLNR